MWKAPWRHDILYLTYQVAWITWLSKTMKRMSFSTLLASGILKFTTQIGTWTQPKLRLSLGPPVLQPSQYLLKFRFFTSCLKKEFSERQRDNEKQIYFERYTLHRAKCSQSQRPRAASGSGVIWKVTVAVGETLHRATAEGEGPRNMGWLVLRAG